MTTYTPPPEPGRTPSRHRPVRLVIGILLALVGFSLLLGGLILGSPMATQRDDDRVLQHPDRAAHHRDGVAVRSSKLDS